MGNIVADYIQHGWQVVAIPPGTKRPNAPGWNTRAGALPRADLLPLNYGVGLMHAYSGTMALDIDNWERTKAYGIDVDALYAAPDAVAINSGKRGHGKLIYRMPLGLVLPTKKFSENKASVFELRCGTMEGMTVQDVLPPSVHPETFQPYAWGGAGHWTRLPMVPDLVLQIWRESLKDSRPATVDGVDSSWDEIREALAHINPDCSRQDWIQAGMAIKWAGEQTFNPDQAFAVWNGWSQQGAKYPGLREITQQWHSFRSEKNSLVTLGTLFHLARLNGWVRPTPDASVLFADTTKMVSPADVMDTMKPKAPDIDLSLWPTQLTRRAQEVSDSVGCDPIVPLWAGLAAVCGVVDAQTRLELMPGFKVPPVLWLMTIGDPGDLKSPGSRPMFSAFRGIELDDKARFAKEVQAWELKEAAYAAARAAQLKFAASDEFLLGGEMPEGPPKPDKPVPVRLTVGDVTSQKLVRMVAERPRGLLCYLDEMNSWTQKLTNRMSGEDRSAWVVGFEAERYEMDRVQDGSTHADNFAVSIFGNMQPRVLEDNFSDLAGDGLLQRFLPAVLRHNQTRLGEPIPDFLTSAAAWENTLRLTYALETKTYRMTQAAFKRFRQFQEWQLERMHSERLIKSSPEFVEAFGKIVGIAGRLALIFHILESPFEPAVDVSVIDKVIRIVREYIVPTYRYVFDGEGSMSAFDSWVMEHIIQHADLDKITMSEIKRSARRPFEKAGIKTSWNQNEWTIGAMYLLEKMQWVARIDDGSQEGKGHAEWLINPNLKTTFKSYRDAVVKAKVERNADRLTRAGSARPNVVHGADDLDDGFVEL